MSGRDIVALWLLCFASFGVFSLLMAFFEPEGMLPRCLFAGLAISASVSAMGTLVGPSTENQND